MLKKIPTYLISLIPLSLIAGPFVAELILLVLSIYFILKISKNEFFLLKNKFFSGFIIFCLYISIRSLFTDQIFISLKSSLLYFRFAFYALAIIYFLNKDKDALKVNYIFYKYTFLFVIIDSLLQVFIGKDLFGMEPNSVNLMRISGPFGDEFVLGSFLQKVLPIFIYLIFKNKEIKNKIHISDYIILIFSFVIIYRSGDRSALGLILFFSFIFFLIYKDFRKKMLLIFGIFIIFSSILSFQNPNISKRVFIDTLGQFKGVHHKKLINESNEGKNQKLLVFSFHHQSHFTTAYKMFVSKPIIGHGLKMFRFKCKNFIDGEKMVFYGCSTHPHNTYMQLLAETGIIGFLTIFCLFLIIGFKIVKKVIKKNIILKSSDSLLIAIFVNLWPLIPTGNFFNNWLSMLYFLPIAFYLFETKKLGKFN
tara:strand:+ start:23 stop:1288 length:1266 start_codon:yes stop_codon:yes gene_type:complete